MSDNSIISIKDLCYRYDTQEVLHNINLEVKERDFLAIIGPNGGGKSTLLKTILGINEVQKGTIQIFNQPLSKNLAKVGYVPQNTNINTNFPIKVIEVVMMGHIHTPKERKSSRKPWHRYLSIGYNEFERSCAMSVLKQVGMEKYANEKIGSLSGGQRQRVMIARALCAHPAILLLDEPTANIDVEGQKQIYELLRELNHYITIIVVSHDISVVLSYASKVAHINKSITFHDISNYTDVTQHENGHFCEVEMLQRMGKACSC
jgi:zinc transport system ATP-binding protein